MAKSKKQETKDANFRRKLIEEMLKLATSGFGLVAALAWNELIKEFVSQYIKPIAGENSGMISLFLYALIITTFAVLVTYFLAKIVKKEE